MQMNAGDIITFDVKKNFTFVKPLGGGGTGDTLLFKDETTNEVKLIIDDWVDYYNNDRYQWQLAKLSPNEYYNYLLTGNYPIPGQRPEIPQEHSEIIL